MKILSPLSCSKETSDLIKAGAEEFYCGVIREKNKGKIGCVTTLDRRGTSVSKFESFEDLKKAVDIAHKNSCDVCFVVNEHYYVMDQYKEILSHINKAVECGVDSLIVADPALMIFLQKKEINLPLHSSTECATFNTEQIKLFKRLGVKRIILPQHLTLKEIDYIRDHTDLELEAFILPYKCSNVDGFCTFHHASPLQKSHLDSIACRLPYRIETNSTTSNGKLMEKVAAVREKRFNMSKGCSVTLESDVPSSCAICNLYEFNDVLSAGKIAGREQPTEKKIKYVEFASQLKNFLEKKQPAKEEFIEEAKKVFSRIFNEDCDERCYYN